MDFLDYAMLQGWIDEHDKYSRAHNTPKTGDELILSGVACDCRNMIQSKIEQYVFKTWRPAVGERYGAYLTESHGAVITTWTGDPLMTVTGYGATWKRWTQYGKIAYQTVYAKDDYGATYRGILHSDQDLIMMRRTA